MEFTYTDFSRHIDRIKYIKAMEDEIHALSNNYGVQIEMPTLIDSVVELLEHILNDEDDLIGRWIFEKESDAELSKINSAKELWECLH